MKTKTKINKQIRKKKNPELVKALVFSNKNPELKRVSEILSRPKRKGIIFNLGEIDNLVSEGETVIVPGKVLSQGNLNKKINLVAFSFSKKSEEKLLKSGISFKKINEEIKKDPLFKKIKILEKKNGNN